MDRLIATPRSPVTLRPAQEADAQAYRALRLEALSRHPAAFSADYAVSAGQPPTYWLERLRALGAESMMYFAVHDAALVGMCGIYRGSSSKTRHSATLVSVYVQPEWRGQQIADGLIEGCLEWARAQAISIVKLGVSATNVAAIRCYARCSFMVYGLEPQAICADGVMYDELLMARLTDLIGGG